MRIKAFDVFMLRLPFRTPFRHARAERRHSASILVRCELEDGSSGFGEGLPREYVTGETWQGTFEALRDRVLPALAGADFRDYEHLEDFCDGLYSRLKRHFTDLPERVGALCCALELALLDAFGHAFERTAFAVESAGNVRYSGVISGSSPPGVAMTARLCRQRRLPAVKLKVGSRWDHFNTRLARLMLGRKTSLRVDANMAWSPEQALAEVPRLQRHGIDCIEQPLGVGRHAELRRLHEATGVRIVADEDLRDGRDACALIESGACQVFNLRLSKCGGWFETLRLARLAREHGLGVQVGCQVGESALLSAVGLALARRLGDALFVEGCFGPLLLASDLIPGATPEAGFPFVFGMGGNPPHYVPRHGIGIVPDTDLIHRHSVTRARIEHSARSRPELTRGD